MSDRIEDLGPGDFVHVECAACGHDVLIPSIGLQQGLKLPPHQPVLDLERRFRCRECDTGSVDPVGRSVAGHAPASHIANITGEAAHV
jgi:hypothetical protein